MYTLVRLRSYARYTLTGTVYDSLCVGRSTQNELQTEDRLLSSGHARFVIRDGALQIVDLDSRNGTEVNGKRLDPFEPFRLRHGDVIDFAGRLSFKLSIADDSPYPVIAVDDGESAAVGAESDSVLRVLALPDGLTPVLEPARLLSLNSLLLRLLDPDNQRQGGRWLERLVTGAARLLKVPEVQLIRLVDNGHEVVHPTVPESPFRAESLAECLRREQTVAVEVTAFSEQSASESSSTFEMVGDGQPFLSTVCGPVQTGAKAWGALYAAAMGGPRRTFDEQDVWLLQRLCTAVSHLLAQVSVAQLLDHHRSRLRRVATHALATQLVGSSHVMGQTVAALADVAGSSRPCYLIAAQSSMPTGCIQFIHRLSVRAGARLELVAGDRLAELERKVGLDRLLNICDGGTLGIVGIEGLAHSGQQLVSDALRGPWGQRVRLVATGALPAGQLVHMLGFDAGLAGILGGCVVRVPTLRERSADIEAIVRAVAKAREPHQRAHFAQDAITWFKQHMFPGGLEQLMGIVEAALSSSSVRPLTRAALVTLFPALQEPAQPVDRCPELAGFHAAAGRTTFSVPLCSMAADFAQAGLLDLDD